MFAKRFLQDKIIMHEPMSFDMSQGLIRYKIGYMLLFDLLPF